MAAELLKRIFEREIASQLFPDDMFLTNSRNDDKYAGSTNSVELPNAGTIPTVKVNRVTVPATITQRTDVAHNYELEELTTDPTLFQWTEALGGGGRINYDKRADLFSQHQGSIREKAANRTIYKWGASLLVASGNLFASTGSVGRPATGPSQTGSRKEILEADLLRVKELFDRQNVPLTGRHMLITGAQHTDLLKIARFTEADKLGRAGAIANGAVGTIHGFSVFVRSSVAVTNGSDVMKAEGAAAAATDQDVALFWQRDHVRKALGRIKAFINLDESAYYGDIMSFGVMFGAVLSRNDGIGVAGIFEDTV